MTREEKIALLIDELEDIRCDNFDADTDEDKTLKEAIRVIKVLEQESCDKCVYSTKDGYCQYDDITEAIPPFEPCDDAVSRETVKTEYKRRLEANLVDESRGIDWSEYANCEPFNKFIDSIPRVKPQVIYPGYGIDCEDCPAYEPKTDVLDKIRAEIDRARFIDKDTKLCKNANASGLEVAMQIIDKYKAESEREE